MIKVTFQHRDGSTYWAVCERVDWCNDGTYQVSSIMDDSKSMGPAIWTIIPGRWQIMAVEEV